MKQVTNRLVDIGRALIGGVGGARLAQQDSEIEVVPRLQMVVELPSPIKRLQAIAAGTEASDSFGFESSSTQVGVVVAFNSTSATFAKGVWRVSGFLTQYYQAGAPANPGNGSVVGLLSPDGTALTLAHAFYMNGVAFMTFERVFSFDQQVNAVGFALRFSTAATVAGDTMSATTSIFCNRLL